MMADRKKQQARERRRRSHSVTTGTSSSSAAQAKRPRKQAEPKRRQPATILAGMKIKNQDIIKVTFINFTLKILYHLAYSEATQGPRIDTSSKKDSKEEV